MYALSFFFSLVMCMTYLSSWFFVAAKFIPFRNLPQILLHVLYMKNCGFHHLLIQVIIKSDKVPKVSIVPFFHSLIIVKI